MLCLSFLPVSKSRVASVASNEVRTMSVLELVQPISFSVFLLRSTLQAKKLLSESRVFWKSGQIQIQGLIKYSLLTISKAPTKSAENAFPFGQLLQEVAQVARQS